jgi:hypothetical protein
MEFAVIIAAAAAPLSRSPVVMVVRPLALPRHPLFRAGAENVLHAIAGAVLFTALGTLDPSLLALRPLAVDLGSLPRRLALGTPLLALLPLRPRLGGPRRLFPLGLALRLTLRLALRAPLLKLRFHIRFLRLRSDGRRHRRGHQNPKQCLPHSTTPHSRPRFPPPMGEACTSRDERLLNRPALETIDQSLSPSGGATLRSAGTFVRASAGSIPGGGAAAIRSRPAFTLAARRIASLIRG